MTWHRVIDVEFNHCDPAGIVFYPRYFEMTNAAVESLFRDGLRHPFARLVAEGAGVPTARIEIDFRAPSRLGDRLDLGVDVLALGRSSVTFRITATGGDGVLRFEGRFTLVHIGAGGRPDPWPAPLRDGLAAHLTEETP